MVDLKVNSQTPIDEVTEITPEFDISCVKIATSDLGNILLHAILPDYLQKRFMVCSNLEIKIDSDGFNAIGIDNFCGNSLDEVKEDYPEFNKQIEIEPGVFKDLITPNTWNHKDGEHDTCYFVVKSNEYEKHKAKLMGNNKIKIRDIQDHSGGDKTVLKWLDIIIEKDKEKY